MGFIKGLIKGYFKLLSKIFGSKQEEQTQNYYSKDPELVRTEEQFNKIVDSVKAYLDEDYENIYGVYVAYIYEQDGVEYDPRVNGDNYYILNDAITAAVLDKIFGRHDLFDFGDNFTKNEFPSIMWHYYYSDWYVLKGNPMLLWIKNYSEKYPNIKITHPMLWSVNAFLKNIVKANQNKDENEKSCMIRIRKLLLDYVKDNPLNKILYASNINKFESNWTLYNDYILPYYRCSKNNYNEIFFGNNSSYELLSLQDIQNNLY